jgi:hypothetical protein
MVVAVALLACGSSAIPPEQLNPKRQQAVVRRAQFDLACAGPLLTAPLQTMDGYVVSFGVTGCGKRATYVQTSEGVWVVNSISDGTVVATDPSSLQPPPQPPPPHRAPPPVTPAARPVPGPPGPGPGPASLRR